MTDTKTVEIYIQILGDEEGTLRPTQAVALDDNRYKVLPIPNYEQADEEWEFPPGTIVSCETRSYRGKNYLLAIKEPE
ncbi:MAG: hypothetical protein K2Q01_03700 [Rickettsiales bacterium]|nr:hypothetical protein [Rickettsiales bacterium]